jgi:hypothetical protein
MRRKGVSVAKKKSPSLPERSLILDALIDSPDVESVLRLCVTSEPDGQWVIATTVQLIDSMPVYALSSALGDAKRRVRGVVGETADIYVEPELVRDPAREDPATDVIVIKASD